jgi:HEAT repeat protein
MARKDASKRHTAVPTLSKIAGAKPEAAKESKIVATSPVAESAAQPKIAPTAAKAEAAPALTAVAAAAAPVVAAAAPAAKIAAPAAPSQVPALSEVIRGNDADAAREAATSLGLTKEPAAVEPLIEAIRNADGYFHSVVRAAAATSLAQLGDVRAVDALISAINDPMAEASAEAVRALATLGDARAVKPLIEAASNKDGYFLQVVRRAAVTALGKLGGTEAIAELKRVAADTYEDAVIRSAAESALAATSA